MSNQPTKSVKWRRFSNAPYASFQSLHREVKIGILTVAMLSSVSLKSEAKTTKSNVSGAGIAINDDSPAVEDSIVVGLDAEKLKNITIIFSIIA